jgi:hypothetical protein
MATLLKRSGKVQLSYEMILQDRHHRDGMTAVVGIHLDS